MLKYNNWGEGSGKEVRCVERKGRYGSKFRAIWEEYGKGESLLRHVAADVLGRKRKLKLSEVMSLILGAPLIIDQDHSSSELISSHTLEPCNTSLGTGLQNITSMTTGSRTQTFYCIISHNPVSGVRPFKVAVNFYFFFKSNVRYFNGCVGKWRRLWVRM